MDATVVSYSLAVSRSLSDHPISTSMSSMKSPVPLALSLPHLRSPGLEITTASSSPPSSSPSPAPSGSSSPSPTTAALVVLVLRIWRRRPTVGTIWSRPSAASSASESQSGSVSSSSSAVASSSVSCISAPVFVGRSLNCFAGLFPGYALALYLHRFLENSLAPAYAKRTLGISAWAQIIVGGSNFGELLGALSVFLLSDYVTTPVSEC